MPADLTDEELARLEALEAAATPGPLTAMLPNRAIVKDGALVVRFQLCAAADAELFVAARNALPALLASARAVRNVEAAIRELRAEYRLGPVIRKDGTDATPVDLPRHLLDRIEGAITITTTEPADARGEGPT